jgi:hypothetical protein
MLIIVTAQGSVRMARELPLKLNPAKERTVKHSVGCLCELCGEPYPSDLLEIHLLPHGRRGRPGPDLQREILVLCPGCHREIHEVGLPRADQKDLVRSRSAGARRMIRAVLGYIPKPYTPPGVDLAAVFTDACQISGTCLNGSG